MTGALKRMRLFVATRLEESSAERIRSAFEQARSRAGRASWVEAHAFHLTYAFIGEQSAAVADRLAAAIPAALAGFRRYQGALSGCGFFPDERRPRVGWISFETPKALESIASAVRRVLDEQGVAFDRKAFKPHLTVVRIRDRWSGKDVAEFRQACVTMGRIEVTLDRVSLYRSELRRDGARHHEIASAVLDE